ncbi:MAG: hypothetical protein ACWA5P_00040 [bacterium]
MIRVIVLLSLFFSLCSGNIQIIASPNCELEVLSTSEVKQLFLLKKRKLGTEKVIVLDNSDKSTYTMFVRLYLNKSLKNIKAYWTHMLYTGKKRPPDKVFLKELDSFDDESICHLFYMSYDEKRPEKWKSIQIQ